MGGFGQVTIFLGNEEKAAAFARIKAVKRYLPRRGTKFLFMIQASRVVSEIQAC